MTAYINRAIELYVSEDLNKIEEWSNSEESANSKDLLLTREI